jgi:hypothetical protein
MLHGEGRRQPLGEVAQVRLPFALRPAIGAGPALLVAHDDRPGRTFVRSIAASGEASPPLELGDRQPIAALELTEPVLLSSNGHELCVEPLTPSPARPRCAPSKAVAAVKLGDRLGLLEQRSEPEPETLGSSERATEPERVHVWLERRTSVGELEGEATDTGLSYLVPMPGMGLVDAVGSDAGVQLLWYEHDRGLPGTGRRGATAALRTGAIDAGGHFVVHSRTTLFDGERQFGNVAGHLEPRLFGADGRTIYLGRFLDDKARKPKSSCEAKGVQPWARLAGRGPVLAAELAVLDSIRQASPALAEGQPRTEAEQIAWASERGYYLCQGELCSVERATGKTRSEPAPFLAQRSRLHWASFARDGPGIARTAAGHALVAADGSVREEAAPAGAAPPGSDRAWDGFPLPRAVLVGDRWLGLRPSRGHVLGGWSLAELGPTERPAPPLGVAVHPDSAVLVGGASRGMLLALRATPTAETQLLVHSLARDGQAALVHTAPSPIGIGLVAVERAAGGAIVAGWSAREPRRSLVLVVEANGVVRAAKPSGIDPGPRLGRLSLVALPAGGALLSGERQDEVAWIDEEGQEQTRRPWPTARASASCLDGEPARTWVPTPMPGVLVQVEELGRPGTCMLDAPQWSRDGSLRWLGSRSTALDSRAELGLLAAQSLGLSRSAAEGRTAAPDPAIALAAVAPAAAPKPPPCPPDMVFVSARGLCVDRFEVRLGEATTGLALSADYPATPVLAEISLTGWVTGRWRVGDLHAKAMPLPPLLRTRNAATDPVARSGRGLRPSGYLTGFVAEQACHAAGKRLCTAEEFVAACRGEEGRKFPYGEQYEAGACNVFRDSHPAAVLHGNASIGHLDPRLNRVVVDGEPLLRATGATPRCRSRWGDDYVYDLVGNLDEWLGDEHGAFAGGFYARSTRAGCDAIITAHPRKYLDYSTGTRCCLDARVTR